MRLIRSVACAVIEAIADGKGLALGGAVFVIMNSKRQNKHVRPIDCSDRNLETLSAGAIKVLSRE